MKNKRLLQGLFIALVALFSLSGAYAQNVITMTTSKKVGEELDLTIVSKGSFTVQGATRKSSSIYELTATNGRITLQGDITNLYCYNNQLTQLDITKNPALENLYCYKNQLTQLDVTKNTALKDLYCSYNQLTKLDVTKNTALKRLWCSENQLTHLDVTKNTELMELGCSNNQLTLLDVSQNKNLVDLSVSGNRIDRASMDRLVEQLPNISDLEDEEELGFFVAVDTKNPNEGNYLTQSSAAKAKSKGWKVRDYNNGKDASGEDDWRGIPYEGEIGFITMTTRKKVGEVLSLFISSEGSFTVQGATHKGEGKYELTATDGRITLKGNITRLDCNNNQLTQLDVTKNTALEKLVCNNNQLTHLDVTKNTALEKLYCSYNQLTQLDVTKNTALKDLDCDSNQLTKLDVTKNTDLKQLYCYDNQLTHLDVTKNTALKGLGCSNNQLTQLDVTKNTKLEMLVCNNNQLTKLDVSQNKNLVNLLIYGNRIERASMDRLVEQLPSISIPEEEKEDKGFFVAVDTKNPNEGNYLTQSSAAKAKSKGWKVRDYNNGRDANGEWNGQGIPYEGEKDTAIEAISTTSLRLYPNPARNFAILEGVEANALIQIYTLDGVEVLRIVANEVGNARLNLSEIPAGNYIVKSGITATYLQVTQ